VRSDPGTALTEGLINRASANASAKQPAHAESENPAACSR